MDSVTHLALGAAVGMAVMGRRTAVWKAALWGAAANTLPDLDVLTEHGDAISNMVLHRGATHSLFWLTLLSLPLGAAIARLHGEQALWRRWWLAIWLALVTHPLLDLMTVYGTRLALPFSDWPYAVGSIFIIDPLFTLPLLAGAGWALAARGGGRALQANAAGLLLAGAYLAWTVAAQAQVERMARASLAVQGIAAGQLLVTPTAFNTVLWRVVALDGGRYHEGFYSLLDGGRAMHFDAFDRGSALAPALRGIAGVQQVAAFSKGFYKLHAEGDELFVTDLRMGQEPAYVFNFAVAERHSPVQPLAQPEQRSESPELRAGLDWLWRRALGEELAPPR